MKASRHLIVNRVDGEFYVTAYEFEDGRRVDLSDTASGYKTGVLAETVLKDWQKEGYQTNMKIEDRPGRQPLAFFKPDTADVAAFRAKYATGAADTGEPDEKPKVEFTPEQKAEILRTLKW